MTEERRIEVLRLGYFPVTDDFWLGAKHSITSCPEWEGQFDWARCLPNGEFMPYTERGLSERTIDEINYWWSKTCRRVDKPKKQLTVTVSLKDVEPFKALLEVLGKMLTDERVPAKLREDYGLQLAGVIGGVADE